MSQSEVVDARYRIQVEDLQGQECEWLIANISYQGVEEMSPVLHFETMTKRLVLDQEQSRQMIALTRSALPEEWIGARIRVAPVRTTDEDKIAITAADIAGYDVRWSVASRTRNWLGRILFGSSLLAGFAALTVLLSLFGRTF